MGKFGVLGILCFIGVSLTALSVTASTRGWGAEAPKEDDDDDATTGSNHHRRTYYGGHYLIFYSSPGIRNVRSRRPGGGFHGGK
jgi:hypothetical protein